MSQLLLPVVVGVDGTDESLQAVRYGVHEAQRRGCGLRLVHAAPQYAPMAPTLPLLSVETFEEVGYRIVNEAKQLAHDLTEGTLAVEKLVRSGSRVGILARESENACLVILGRQAHSRFGRIITGS